MWESEADSELVSLPRGRQGRSGAGMGNGRVWGQANSGKKETRKDSTLPQERRVRGAEERKIKKQQRVRGGEAKVCWLGPNSQQGAP